MSNLADLVPPLELCQKIPAGEFEDSLHWYRWSWVDQKYLLDAGKPDVRLYKDPCPCGMKYFYPAPTLKEIMAKLPACQCYRLGELWTVALANDSIKSGMRSGKPETAALRQYLELKQGRTVEVMVRNIGNAKCEYCGKPTVFHHITANEETLAPEFVEMMYDRVAGDYRYYSMLTGEFYNSREEAIAATVARLKEVRDA